MWTGVLTSVQNLWSNAQSPGSDQHVVPGPQVVKEACLKDGEYVVQLDQPLGSGSMGETYQGTHSSSDTPVAVKKITRLLLKENDKEKQELPLVTTEMLEKLAGKCPNVVSYLDFIMEKDECWVVLELCPMGNLEEFLKYFGPVPVPRTAVYLEQMSSGVKFLHEQEVPIAHRCITLHNVLVHEQFNNFVMKISDYALTTLISEESAVQRQIFRHEYTEKFMPPEYFWEGAKELGTSSDIYSLGMVFQVLLDYKTDKDPLIPGSVSAKKMSIPQAYGSELLLSTTMGTDRPKLFPVVGIENNETGAALLRKLQALVEDMTSYSGLTRPEVSEICGVLREYLVKDPDAKTFFNAEKERRVTECKKATAKFLKIYPRWEAERKEVIKYVETVATEQHIYHKTANYSNVLGSSVGILGTAMVLGGVVAAPFTFGTSLVVSKIGAGVGLAGGLTTVGATAGEAYTEKGSQSAVQARIKDHGELTREIIDLGSKIKFLCDEIKRLETLFPSEVVSLEAAEMAELSATIFDWMKSPNMILGESCFLSVGQLTKLALLATKGSIGVVGLGAIVDVYNITSRSWDLKGGSTSHLEKECKSLASQMKAEMDGFCVFYEAIQTATQKWKEELEALKDDFAKEDNREGGTYDKEKREDSGVESLSASGSPQNEECLSLLSGAEDPEMSVLSLWGNEDCRTLTRSTETTSLRDRSLEVDVGEVLVQGVVVTKVSSDDQLQTMPSDNAFTTMPETEDESPERATNENKTEIFRFQEEKERQKPPEDDGYPAITGEIGGTPQLKFELKVQLPETRQNEKISNDTQATNSQEENENEENVHTKTTATKKETCNESAGHFIR